MKRMFLLKSKYCDKYNSIVARNEKIRILLLFIPYNLIFISQAKTSTNIFTIRKYVSSICIFKKSEAFWDIVIFKTNMDVVSQIEEEIKKSHYNFNSISLSFMMLQVIKVKNFPSLLSL